MNNEVVAEFLLEKYGKKNPPQVKAGDTVRVHQRIKEGSKERTQIFEGLVIATKHGNSLDGSFTVRKIAVGSIGVERTYPVHSPNILKVERIKNASVSRSKLYYMRDRKGKSARFKNEGPDYLTWVEPTAEEMPEAIAEVPAAEEEMAPVEEVVAVEETPAPVVEEAPTATEEVAETEETKEEEKTA